MSSITFPAVSALVSQSADPDKQGEPLLFLTSVGQVVVIDFSEVGLTDAASQC